MPSFALSELRRALSSVALAEEGVQEGARIMHSADGAPDIWSGGQLMAFSGVDGRTDFANGLTARTAFDGVGIDVKLPGACRLAFSEDPPGRVALAGDYFGIDTPRGSVRGAFLDAHHLLIEGPCDARRSSREVAVVQEGGRTLVGAAARFDPGRIATDLDMATARRRRWLESRQLPPEAAGPAFSRAPAEPDASGPAFSRAPAEPDASGPARRTLRKALSLMKTQVYAPEGVIAHRWTTPDRWPHREMWLWDSAFHAIGWRHVDVGLAREMISAVLDVQREDGFVPHRANPEGTSDITQPPVLALSVKLVEEIQSDPGWVEEVYPKLAACVEWDLANRDSDGAGLVEWAIGGDVNCRSGESGMDNSPRFDSATRLDATDFNSYLALECEILALFARSLGRPDDAERHDRTRRRLCGLINERLWNDEAGFYVDYDVEADAPSTVLASSGFLPLICGAASVEQARRLGQKVLVSRAE